MAQAVETLEDSFIGQNLDEIKVSLNEDTFNRLMLELNNNTNDNKCTISIGSANFIFLKK
jgi:hypothetical protein